MKKILFLYLATFIASASAYIDSNGSIEAARNNSPLTPGKHPSTISPAYDIDYHRIEISENGYLSISTIDTDLPLQKYLYRERDGKYYRSGSGPYSEIMVFVEPGTYYHATMASRLGQTGHYTLKYIFVPSLVGGVSIFRPDTKDINLPYSERVEFTYDKTRQYFRITLDEPGIVSFDMIKEYGESINSNCSLSKEGDCGSIDGSVYCKPGDTKARTYYRLDAGSYIVKYHSYDIPFKDPDNPSGIYPVTFEFGFEPEVPLFPNTTAFRLEEGKKVSSWFGVFNDDQLPIIEHCVLGTVEYEFSNGQHILHSARWGKLTISKGSIFPDHATDAEGFLMEEQLKVISDRMNSEYSVSGSTDDCVLKEDAPFRGPRNYNEQYVWTDSIGLELDDVIGFYNWAQSYVVSTQIAAAGVRNLINMRSQGAAYLALTRAGENRDMAIHHCLNALNAIQLREGLDQEFWRGTVQHLIDTVESALQTAQTDYVNTYYGNP